MDQLSEWNILTELFKNAALHPQKIALWAGAETLSYMDLAIRIRHLASALNRRDLKKGDYALQMLDSSIPSLVLHFALLYLGAITIPISPLVTRAQIEELMKRYRPRLICLRNDQQPSHFDSSLKIYLSTDTITNLSGVICLEELFNETSGESIDQDVSLEDPVLLCFTSGTTGKPKGSLLTLRNISASADHINKFTSFLPSDIEVVSLPLSHSFGMGRIRCVLSAGGSAVLLPLPFRVDHLLTAIRNNLATAFAQVPAGLRMLFTFGERIRRFTESVRLIEVGSAVLSVEEKLKLQELFPQAKIFHHYGLTEASRSIFLDYAKAKTLGKLDSIGVPSPGVEVKIIPQPDSIDLGHGEIAVRGKHVSRSYISEQGELSGVDSQGWLHTGDFGRVDEQGYFYYEARKADVVNIGGYKISLLEVEGVLRKCTNFEEVAVVGNRSDSPEELICYYEARRDIDLSDLKDKLVELIEPYKIPRNFIRVENLPRSESGKVIKHLLVKN